MTFRIWRQDILTSLLLIFCPFDIYMVRLFAFDILRFWLIGNFTLPLAFDFLHFDYHFDFWHFDFLIFWFFGIRLFHILTFWHSTFHILTFWHLTFCICLFYIWLLHLTSCPGIGWEAEQPAEWHLVASKTPIFQEASWKQLRFSNYLRFKFETRYKMSVFSP